VESAEIITNLLQLADGVGTLMLAIYYTSLFVSGKVLPRNVANDMLTAERSGESKTDSLHASHQQQVIALYEQVIATKDARIVDLEKRLIEKEKLAELGLQQIMASQRIQDRSASLIAKVAELGPMGMLGVDLSGEE